MVEFEILHKPSLKKFLIRLEPRKFAYLGYEIGGTRYTSRAPTPTPTTGAGE